jgi:hypothetical protein
MNTIMKWLHPHGRYLGHLSADPMSPSEGDRWIVWDSVTGYVEKAMIAGAIRQSAAGFGT